MTRQPDVDRAPAPLVGVRRTFSPGEALAWHHHRKGQLLYATQGVMQVRTDEGTWVLPAGRAVWIPPGLSHAFDCRRETHVHALYTSPGLIDLPASRCRVVDVSRLLHELLLRAVVLPRDYPPDSPEHRLAAVIADELVGLEGQPLHLPLPADARARRLCAWLMAHPDADDTLARLAPRFGAGERTLARLIADETGLSFGDWRLRMRMQQAVERLAAGEPVTTIAMDLGYRTTSGFIDAFKRTFGVTPGRYFAGRGSR